MKFKKFIYLVVNFLLLFSLFYTLTFIKVNLNIYFKLIILLSGFMILGIALLCKYHKKQQLYKMFYLLFVLFTVIVCAYFILLGYGIITKLSSVTSLKNYILTSKGRGVLIYIILQAAQVIILPVPAAVICIVGSLVYGAFLGAIYCTIGILIGSYISYYIGKIFGHRIVAWLVGNDNVNKYSDIIKKRGKIFLSLAFLLPLFPDDILCVIAGITGMSFKSFFWITLITRPIGVICMSYFGSGSIIPFTGWGIYAWCGILLFAIFLVILISKHQEKMQQFILKKILRKNN